MNVRRYKYIEKKHWLDEHKQLTLDIYWKEDDSPKAQHFATVCERSCHCTLGCL